MGRGFDSRQWAMDFMSHPRKHRWPVIMLYVAGVLFALHTLARLLAAGELEEAARLAPKYKAEAEVRLADGTRVDLLSATHAWEVEYPKSGKCYECVGQALYYAIQTGRKPGVILLVSGDPREERYIERTRKVCERLWIDLHLEAVALAR